MLAGRCNIRSDIHRNEDPLSISMLEMDRMSPLKFSREILSDHVGL